MSIHLKLQTQEKNPHSVYVIDPNGKEWHDHCMCCQVCQIKLEAGQEMAVGPDGLPYCPEHYASSFADKCPGCGEAIMEGEIITIGDDKWHLNCVHCVTCARAIGDEEVFMDKPDGEDGRVDLYCRKDYEHLLLLRQAPTCKACKLKIDPTCQQGAKVKDATYHRTCLICAGCDTPLKQVAEKEGHLLCKECLLKYLQTSLIRGKCS